MIVEYRKMYLKKWLPLFVTAADYALPFFSSVLQGVKNVTVHVISQIFPFFVVPFFYIPFFSIYLDFWWRISVVIPSFKGYFQFCV